jgi:hypothetical protein
MDSFSCVVDPQWFQCGSGSEISARLKSVSPGAACQEFSLRYGLFIPLFWIRNGFNADPDPRSAPASSPSVRGQPARSSRLGMDSLFLCFGSAMVSVRIRIRDLCPPQVRQSGGSLPGILTQVWTVFAVCGPAIFQCKAMTNSKRIRILVRLSCYKNKNFYVKNVLNM